MQGVGRVIYTILYCWSNLSSSTDSRDWIPHHKDMTDDEIKLLLFSVIEPVINFITSESKAYMNGENASDIGSDTMKSCFRARFDLSQSKWYYWASKQSATVMPFKVHHDYVERPQT